MWAAAGVDAAVQEIKHITGQGDAWVQVDRELTRPARAAAETQADARPSA